MSLGPLLEALREVPDLALREREPMSRHTDLRVGGVADLWLAAETTSAVEAAARACRGLGIKLHCFQQSGVLVRDGGLNGVWLRMGGVAHGVEAVESGLSVGALHPVAALDAFLRMTNRPVIPHLSGRAGTVAEAFHAGLLSGWVERCQVLRGTKVATLPVEKRSEKQPLIRLYLREAALPDADLEGQLRLLPEQIQALGMPGRIMEDPPDESAALLIREAGLSGVRLRGARIGSLESNALVNLGGASAQDIWLVFQMIRDRVKMQSGHQLHTSVRRIGRGME